MKGRRKYCHQLRGNCNFIKMIQIIDYGAGNIKSVVNALKKLGEEYEIIFSPKVIRNDSKIIFPGVGAAFSAM